jgi:hypothetical protein
MNRPDCPDPGAHLRPLALLARTCDRAAGAIGFGLVMLADAVADLARALRGKP